jgi:hypothetical protein
MSASGGLEEWAERFSGCRPGFPPCGRQRFAFYGSPCPSSPIPALRPSLRVIHARLHVGALGRVTRNPELLLTRLTDVYWHHRGKGRAMSGWQPQQYDPGQQWRAGGPPQDDGWGPSLQGRQPQAPSRQYPQPQYQRPEPRQQYQQPRYSPPRQMNPYAGWVAFAVAMVVIIAGAAWYFLKGSTSPAPPAAGSGGTTSQAAGQPETEAAVRSDATAFYALYAASQWAQAWAMLAPSAQQAVSESTYVAVHQGCPIASAGMARVIKSITVAGSTAVVTETVAGALSSLGSVTDAWAYSGGRWGITLDPSGLKDYSHGSAAADVAAMKAAGDCAS